MNEWKPILARMSLFPTAPPLPSALELYKQLWKSDPDNFQKPPNPLLPSLAKARRGGLNVGCSVHPQRIDITLTSSSLEGQMSSETLDLIEDIGQLNNELLEIVSGLGKETVSHSVNRVAFYVQFFSVKPNRVEANKAVLSIVPEQYRVKLVDEEEFILQISHPRMSSKVNNIKMNFISKWSVERIQILTISLPPTGAPSVSLPGIGAPRAKEFLAASATFDINNMPTDQLLTAAQQSSLLLEGLTAAQQLQQNYGLDVKGFEHVKLNH